MKKLLAILTALSVALLSSAVALAAPLGDVNNDGRIDSADALAVLKYSVGSENKVFFAQSADVNGDGKINSSDALAILKVSVGLEEIDPNLCINHGSHSWSEWKTTVSPTTSAAGEKQRSCTVCGKIEKKTVNKLETSENDYMQEVLRLVNIEREKNGVTPLKYCYAAQEAADIRAKEISVSFSHTRPDGSSCFSVFDPYNLPWYSVGENIAYGYRTPEEVVDAWMNSPGHRANILSANFNYLAVGVSGTFWVQLFLGM